MILSGSRLALGAVVGVFGLFAASCSTASGTSLEDRIDAAEESDSSAGDSGRPAGADDNPGADAEEDAAVFVRPVVEIQSEWDSAIEAVYGRYWLYWDAFAAAHGLPHADATYGPLRELSTKENWASLQVQLQDFADDGVVLILPDPSATEHMIRVPNSSILTEEEGAEVIIQDCWIDDFVQQTLDGEVIDEGKEAKLMNVVMTVEDGEWRVDGVSRATAESDGYEQCETLVS